MLFTSARALASTLGHLRAQNGVLEPHALLDAELGDEPLELAAVLPLGRVEGGAEDLEPNVDAAVERELHAAQDRLEPLRARVAAEGGEPEVAGAVRAFGTGELGQVDAVPDRHHLLRVDRKRAPVDRDDRRRRARRGLQRPRSRPVRVPEQQRHSERADERCCQHGVDRAHVRDDGDRPRERAPARAPPGSVRRDRRASATRTRASGSCPAARRRRFGPRARRPRPRAQRVRGSSARSRRAPDGRGRPAA